jgi:hypothetical protein
MHQIVNNYEDVFESFQKSEKQPELTTHDDFPSDQAKQYINLMCREIWSTRLRHIQFAFPPSSCIDRIECYQITVKFAILFPDIIQAFLRRTWLRFHLVEFIAIVGDQTNIPSRSTMPVLSFLLHQLYFFDNTSVCVMTRIAHFIFSHPLEE